MASDEQRLQIWPAPGSLSDIMVRGNMLLSTGKTAEAINYYTHVLHKLSPGHVCAFLNRSIAYLEEGCYELAVMDAHRAKIAVDEMRNVRGMRLHYDHEELFAPLSFSRLYCLSSNKYYSHIMISKPVSRPYLISEKGS